MSIIKKAIGGLKIAGLSLVLGLGTLFIVGGLGTTVVAEVEESKAKENIANAENIQELKDEEAERIENLQATLATIEQAFENGEMANKEYRKQINAIHKDIQTYENDIIESIYNNSNDPSIVKNREKVKYLSTTGCALAFGGITIGAFKGILSMAGDEKTHKVLIDDIKDIASEMKTDKSYDAELSYWEWILYLSKLIIFS